METTRTALITGGTRGFGFALASSLVADGWRVVIDGRDRHTLDAALELLGPAATGVAGDVTDPAHRRTLVSAAQAGGRLDVLVNNASTLGPTPLPPLRALGPASLAELFAVNVIAPLGLVQLALPLLRASSGTIVSVTSDAAIEAYDGWGGYGASKAALEQLTAVLAAEEPGLSVWSFDPGDMRTEMHQDAFPAEDIGDRPLPEEVAVPALRRLLWDRPPSGRYRAADVVAGADR
jgi:NAD(P)-dependent dehydrogenase (short-subunit alcohol dehydrogenase family)